MMFPIRWLDSPQFDQRTLPEENAHVYVPPVKICAAVCGQAIFIATRAIGRSNYSFFSLYFEEMTVMYTIRHKMVYCERRSKRCIFQRLSVKMMLSGYIPSYKKIILRYLLRCKTGFPLQRTCHCSSTPRRGCMVR